MLLKPLPPSSITSKKSPVLWHLIYLTNVLTQSKDRSKEQTKQRESKTIESTQTIMTRPPGCLSMAATAAPSSRRVFCWWSAARIIPPVYWCTAKNVNHGPYVIAMLMLNKVTIIPRTIRAEYFEVQCHPFGRRTPKSLGRNGCRSSAGWYRPALLSKITEQQQDDHGDCRLRSRPSVKCDEREDIPVPITHAYNYHRGCPELASWDEWSKPRFFRRNSNNSNCWEMT
jgi:hypothetical protein